MFGTEYLIIYELNEDKRIHYDKYEIFGCGIITRIEGEDVFIYDVIESKDVLTNTENVIDPKYNIGCKLKILIEDYGDVMYENLYRYFSNQVDKSLDNKDIDKFNTYSKHLNELKMEGCVIWS